MRRNATLFVLISLLAGFGSTAMSISAGLWLLDLTHSFALAALAGLCTYGPTFLGPWLGAVVDRLPRRPLLIGVDVALGLLLLTLLTVHSSRGAWLIYGVLLARGISYGLLDAGETAILPAALPPSALGNVNGWRSSAQEGTKLLAPLAGAGLYAWQGPVPVILLCAAMPLATGACYALLRLNPTSATRTPSTNRAGVWSGIAVLVQLPAVRVPVLVAAAAIAMSGLTDASVLAHLVRDLDLPSSRLGFVSSAQGAGSIVGGLLVGRLLRGFGPARVAALGAVLFGIGRLGWCLPWFPPAVAGSLLIGLGLPWTLIAGITAIQTDTPAHLLGRVAATSNTVMFGPVALAIPLGSALVHLGSIVPMLTAVCVAFAAAAFGARARPSAEPAVAGPPDGFETCSASAPTVQCHISLGRPTHGDRSAAHGRQFPADRGGRGGGRHRLRRVPAGHHVDRTDPGRPLQRLGHPGPRGAAQPGAAWPG